MKNWIFGLLAFALLACGQPSPTSTEEGTEEGTEEKVLTSMQSDLRTIDYLMGKFDPGIHPDFEVIPVD